MGYLMLWVGLSGVGVGIAVFFKSGPFACNGLVGFYIPIVAFTIWMVVAYHMHTGIKSPFESEKPIDRGQLRV